MKSVRQGLGPPMVRRAGALPLSHRAGHSVRDGRWAVIRGGPATAGVGRNAPPVIGANLLRARAARTATRPSWSTRTTRRDFRGLHPRWRLAVAGELNQGPAGERKGGPASPLIMRNLPEWAAILLRRDGLVGAIHHAPLKRRGGPEAELEYGLVDSGAKGRLRRRRAAGAHRGASDQLPRPQDGLCQPPTRTSCRIRS